ncbi:hypothetical protein [Pseudomonas fluorescens]|uniref:hypothetical protein n=1 Tax=Pseudomonas fluorescens TaxID=294 RepID=UPI00124263FC|nr:hypothetical protein [Pseudomonas fluorescens]
MLKVMPDNNRTDAVCAGAAEGCDLLILIFVGLKVAEDQKIAACASSYMIPGAQMNCAQCRTPCRSRLAGEGGFKPCIAHADAFASKPAPTGVGAFGYCATTCATGHC